jgi:hypothetical protein
MPTNVRYFWRLIIAYLFAACFMGLFNQVSVGIAGAVANNDDKLAYFIMRDYARPSYLAAFMTLPLLIWLFVAEFWGLRNWILHIAAGVICSVASVYHFAFGADLRNGAIGGDWAASYAPFMKSLFTPSAIVGLPVGLIVWAICGRMAGQWHQPEERRLWPVLMTGVSIIAASVFFFAYVQYSEFGIMEKYQTQDWIEKHTLAALVAGALFGSLREWSQRQYSVKRHFVWITASSFCSASVLMTIGGHVGDYYYGPWNSPYVYIFKNCVISALIMVIACWFAQFAIERLRGKNVNISN